MAQKTKIIIAGIGGVGGYYGGMLAREYENSNDVEVVFLARGEHLKAIQQNGLKVITKTGDFVARPYLATDNAAKIGIADFIIVCTKSYDLETTLEQLELCVGPETVLLPLLNGVDSMEKIKRAFPQATVFNGCVYIISSIKAPGMVENSGIVQRMYFGIENTRNERLDLLETILHKAHLEATLCQNITAMVWEKFHFVGANSTATSYFDLPTQEIFADPEKKDFLLALLYEVNQVALAKGIVFDKDLVAVTREKLIEMPNGATSSMQRDFKKGNGKTELETITGYVVRAGKELKIAVPTFEKAYKKLSS